MGRGTLPCSVDGCESLASAGRGWCPKHWMRWKRHGDPLGRAPGRKPPRPADPGVQPVVCDACGSVVCADPDTPALAAAKFNHAKYCEPIKRRKTMTDVQTDARRRLALLAQREEIDQALAEVDARLLAACPVGERIEVDGQPVFRVQQRRTFDVEVAKRVVPAALIAAATVPTVDAKALKALLPPAVLDACMVEGAVFVARAGR